MSQGGRLELSRLYMSTRKPVFFGGYPWPPFDPEADEPIGVLPAKERYENELAD